jgi:hypothetical protein
VKAVENRVTPAVASLAMLKVLWDRHRKDYLGTFVPIVVETIRRSGWSVVALGDLQGAIESDFGLRIPQHALEAILRRCTREGYLRLKDRAYLPVSDRISGHDFDRIQREITRIHDDVVRDLCTFAAEHVATEWSTQQAEEALLDLLRQRRMQLGSKQEEPLVRANDAGRGARFVVASYIARLREEKSPRLRDIEALAQGYMLANVLYLPDPGQTSKRFRGTQLYLDTPFLMHALGYSGPAREAPAKELLRLLYEVGANLRCYRHTRDELGGVLDACAGHVRRGPDAALRGPAVESVQHFLAAGYTASDVELLASRLDRALEALRISVTETPTYREHSHVIDEAGLATAIRTEITPYREGALEKDVASVAAIVRERAGKVVNQVEDCIAILVTTNVRLVRVVREFSSREGSRYAVPPCISDYSLANLLWLKRPTAAPDLPIKRLIADCYATLQPDEELWSAFEAEAKKQRDDRTITADDYYDLRYSLSTKDELMHLTKGDPEAFAHGTVLDVLKRVKEHREASARAVVSNELSEARSGRRHAESEVGTRKLRELSQRQALHRRSRRMAKWIARALFAAIGLLLAIGAWAASPWGTSALSNSATGHLLSGLAAIAVIAGVASLVTGGTVLSISRQFEIGLEARLTRIWYWMASMPQELED